MNAANWIGIIGSTVTIAVLMWTAVRLHRTVAARDELELRALQAEGERDAWRDSSEHWLRRADYYQDRLDNEIARHHGGGS